jgi:diguanylate cyclase (GGDEF)-like protein
VTQEFLQSLGQLLRPTLHPVLLSRQRAAVLIARTRTSALGLAALTLLFAAVDALVFPSRLLLQLALARLVAASALVGLGWCMGRARTLRGAYLGMLGLFGIPALFLFVSGALMAAAPLSGFGVAVAAIYTLMPFVMASAIAIFPLAWFEALTLGLLAMAVEAGALATQHHYAWALTTLGVVWLALLVTVTSVLASMIQVNLMATILAQTTHDPLTGCYVRRTGEELLAMHFSLAARRHQPLALLFIDLDHFKAVNDDYGHERGDAVLAQVGVALRAALRGSDLAVRWGGEEFLLVLPGTDPGQAMGFAERLRARGLGMRPEGAPLTASMGVASYPADAVADWPVLVERADARMYQAKQAGRDRVQGL